MIALTSAWWLTPAADYRQRRGREGEIVPSTRSVLRNQFTNYRASACMSPNVRRTWRWGEEGTRCTRVCTLLIIGSNVCILDVLFFEAAPKGFYSFVYVTI